MTSQPLGQQLGTHSRDWGNRSGAWNGYALAPADRQASIRDQAALACQMLDVVDPYLAGRDRHPLRPFYLIPFAHGSLTDGQTRDRLQSGPRSRSTTLSLPAGQVGRVNFWSAISGSSTLIQTRFHKFARQSRKPVCHLERPSYRSVAYSQSCSNGAFTHAQEPGPSGAKSV